jgi:hypothetical protein
MTDAYRKMHGNPCRGFPRQTGRAIRAPLRGDVDGPGGVARAGGDAPGHGGASPRGSVPRLRRA